MRLDALQARRGRCLCWYAKPDFPAIYAVIYTDREILLLSGFKNKVYLSNSKEQSPSWEVNRFSASRKSPRFMEPKVYYPGRSSK